VQRVALADGWAARDLVLCVRDALPAYAAELVAYALRDAPLTNAPRGGSLADGPAQTKSRTRPRPE
jgi:hypothetical protein